MLVITKSLLKVCSLPDLDGEVLVGASNNVKAWLQYDNVVIVFLLHKVFSAVTIATKRLQKMGLLILDGIESLKKCKQQLQECSENLGEYLQQAIKFIENTNRLIENDKFIQDL